MSRTPLVSVIIPAYNVARYIRDAVESVLRQTIDDLEVIVVDDGSTDDTSQCVKQLGDPRIRLIRQHNAKLAAARNTGIRSSSGRYLGFLDGDDLWMHNKLERHLDILERDSSIALTFSRSGLIDELGQDIGRASRQEGGPVSFERLLTKNLVFNGSAVVLRREAIDRVGDFDCQLCAMADHELWLRIASIDGHKVYCIPEPLTLYRMRSGQMSKDGRAMEREWHYLFQKIAGYKPSIAAGVESAARGELYRYLAYIAYENRDFSQAATHLKRSVQAAPGRVLADRGTWFLILGLLMRALLTERLHHGLDIFGRSVRRIFAVSKRRMITKGRVA